MSGKTVRRLSCRSSTSRSAARSAATSSSPDIRSRKGMLYVGLGPSSRSRNHSRAWANDGGNGSGRSTVAALAELLDTARAARTALVPVDRPDPMPLSFAQARLWFLDRLDGPNPTYNIPFLLRMSGELDVAALRAALRDVLLRHESLRTVFPDTAGEPRQHLVAADELPPLPYASEVTAADLPAALAAAASHSFRLAGELPLRAELFHLGGGEHVLSVVVHHIAGDGWSLAPLVRDLSAAYTARCDGRAPGWEPLPVTYADYTLWQRSLLGEDSDETSPLARQLAYWKSALTGLPEELALPTDRPRPAVASHRGAVLDCEIGPELHRELLDVPGGRPRPLDRAGGAGVRRPRRRPGEDPGL
ncbi:hypothetical protein SANTM175S_06317 [Streptomyces antimycoticus]